MTKHFFIQEAILRFLQTLQHITLTCLFIVQSYTISNPILYLSYLNLIIIPQEVLRFLQLSSPTHSLCNFTVSLPLSVMLLTIILNTLFLQNQPQTLIFLTQSIPCVTNSPSHPSSPYSSY